MQYFKSFFKKKNLGFTLIEILITIGIIAVLTTISIIAINPVEINKQSRDSERISELKDIQKGLQLADLYNLPSGAVNTVYLSLPDSSATCGNHILPQLPTGFSYSCKSETNFRKTDGTGWLPVNFNNISGSSLFSTLPIDPTNNNKYYYSYIKGSYLVSAAIESTQFLKKNAKSDGGRDPLRYEVSSPISAPPIGGGLISLWGLNDGTGVIALDDTLSGHNGNVLNGGTFTTTASNCVLGGCIILDGLNDYISVSNNLTDFKIDGISSFSFSFWLNPNSADIDSSYVISKPWNGNGEYNYLVIIYPDRTLQFAFGSSNGQYGFTTNPGVVPSNTWTHVAFTIDSVTKVTKLFINGSKIAEGVHSISNFTPVYGDSTLPLSLGTIYPYGSGWGGITAHAFQGKLDEIYIYKRVLSDIEVARLYEIAI